VTNTIVETPGHLAGDTFSEGGRWCTPCECGRRFTSDTEAKAQARWRSHAKQSSPPQTVGAPVPARATECGCGCGEPLAPKAGGLFRSGHDARYKAILTRAHAAHEQVRHPWTGEQADPMAVADWLDERRGGGTFWRDRVAAGHKPQPERRVPAPRAGSPDAAAASILRVDSLMAAMTARRPVPGDVGKVALKSGTFGARVQRRNNETSLVVRLLEGQAINTEIVISDDKFTKAKAPR